MICTESGGQLGGGDNILLGIVEVPGDADVSSHGRVLIDRPRGTSTNYPGISVVHDIYGHRYQVDATKILDIAAAPEVYSGLGITLVQDHRANTTDA